MTRDLSVAYVCNDIGIPIFGTYGSSIHLRSLLTHLADQNVDVTAYFQTGGGSNAPESVTWNRIRQFPFQRTSVAQFSGLSDVAKNAGLWDTLRTSQDEYDVVHERYSLHSLAGEHYCSRRGMPFVLEVNAPLVDEKAMTGDLLSERIARRTEERLFSRATDVIVVSEELGEIVAEYRSDDRIHVIPNGVNTTKFDPDRFEQQESDQFVVGFVGSFKQWHGVDLIVDAATELRDLQDELTFLMVGDGPLWNETRQRVSDRGLDEMFEFPGAVAHASVPEYMNRFDVGLAPYPDLERFYFSPIKLFEYMSMGKPPIGSDIGQVSRVIDDGQSGFLVTPGDQTDLANTIKSTFEIWSDNPDLFEQIVNRVNKLAWDKYSWERNAEQIKSVYECALKH